MKYNSLWGLKNILRVSSLKTQLKYASSQAQKYQIQNQNESTSLQTHGRSKKRALFSPELQRDRLEKLENVTSVVIALNHVSWAKVSVCDLTVLNWNAYTLPNYFLEYMTEIDILETAHAVRKKIPTSDLYVMESRPHRFTHYPNDICLRSMLVLLLNALNDGETAQNVVFQKPLILNTLHSLAVGGERTSARKILERKSFLKYSKNPITKDLKSDEGSNTYSSMNVSNEEMHCFSSYSKEKQESLSISLLLALTFLDVAVFQNPESISKVQKKHSPKTIIYSSLSNHLKANNRSK